VARGALARSIDGRRDAGAGRRPGAARAAVAAAGAPFHALAYTADGACLLAGGASRFVCLYAVAPQLLLRRWQVTHNASLAAMGERLSSRDLGEAGHAAELDVAPSDGEGGAAAAAAAAAAALPGARRGDAASRRHAVRAPRTRALAAAPSGGGFAAASSEGLLLYALDEGAAFDPVELGEGVTPAAAAAASARGHHVRALLMALHLNERPLIGATLRALPPAALRLVMTFVPPAFLPRLVDTLAAALHPAGGGAGAGAAEQRSPHLEFGLRALLALLEAHARTLRERHAAHAACMRAAQRALLAHRDALSALVDANRFALDYLVDAAEEGAEGGEEVAAAAPPPPPAAAAAVAAAAAAADAASEAAPAAAPRSAKRSRATNARAARKA